MVVSAADGEREHSQESLCHTTKDRFEERAVFFKGSPGKTGRDADTALTARQDARNLRQRSGIPRGRQKLARTEQGCASAQFLYEFAASTDPALFRAATEWFPAVPGRDDLAIRALPVRQQSRPYQPAQLIQTRRS